VCRAPLILRPTHLLHHYACARTSFPLILSPSIRISLSRVSLPKKRYSVAKIWSVVITYLVLISDLKFRFGEGTVCPVSLPGAAGTRDRLFQLHFYLHQYGGMLFPFCVLYQAWSFHSTHGQWEWPTGYRVIRQPISLPPFNYCIKLVSFPAVSILHLPPTITSTVLRCILWTGGKRLLGHQFPPGILCIVLEPSIPEGHP
jgi:hypothetical protein